jgi:hypothetical protein
MSLKIFVFSVVAIVLGVVFLPTVRYLVWGVDVETEIVTLPGEGSDGGRELEIVTLLGKDSIPAILKPEFVEPFEAEEWMDPDEKVLGVSIGGEHKAYAIKMLSRHEVVNDTIGGEPVAVTW